MKRKSVAVALGTLAFLAVSMPAATQNSRSETYRQLDLFGAVFERVRADYVEKVSDEKLIESAINGMLSKLDPHSSYLDAKTFKEMQVQTRGEFGGLGIEVTMENGVVKVVSPIDETPAAKAGVQPGDLITHIDGTPVLGLTLSEAVERYPIAKHALGERFGVVRAVFAPIGGAERHRIAIASNARNPLPERRADEHLVAIAIVSPAQLPARGLVPVAHRDSAREFKAAGVDAALELDADTATQQDKPRERERACLRPHGRKRRSVFCKVSLSGCSRSASSHMRFASA